MGVLTVYLGFLLIRFGCKRSCILSPIVREPTAAEGGLDVAGFFWVFPADNGILNYPFIPK